MDISEIPSQAKLPTSFAEFQIRIFHEQSTGLDHVALTLGSMSGPDPVLTRMHSECLTGDVFSSLRCDCGPQLNASLAAIAARGWGVVLYLRQEGRGIGLHAKIQAYNLQDKGMDTVDANLMLGHPDDARDYQIASTMLSALGVNEVCLLSNNPDKVTQLATYGITVVDRLPLVVGIGEENREYLATKVERMGHLIKIDESD